MYPLRGIISIPVPPFKRGWHFVVRFLHFVADGVKTELRLRVALSGSCYAEIDHKPRSCSKWNPWSAGGGSCGAKWCFVSWLQFSQNLEELAHGVSPGHADILIQEHEEIAIPRSGLFLPTFMALLPTFGLKVGRKLLKCGQRNSKQT